MEKQTSSGFEAPSIPCLVLQKMPQLNSYRGRVESFKALSRNRVRIDLQDAQGPFELVIDQSWILERGDELILVGVRHESGKVCCYAYENKTKDVRGWNIKSSDLTFVVPFLMLPSMGIYFYRENAVVVAVILAVFIAPSLVFAASGLFSNKLYREARKMLDTAQEAL